MNHYQILFPLCAWILLFHLNSYPVLAIRNENLGATYPLLSSDYSHFVEGRQWHLASVGYSATSFVQGFFSSSPTASINLTIRAGVKDKSKFVRSAVFYTLIYQIPMTIVIGIGIICAIVLLTFPFFIYSYQKQDMKYLNVINFDSCIEEPQNAWIVFSIFIAVSAVAVFGAILTVIASIEMHLRVPEVFDFVNFAVDLSYNLKKNLLNNFQYGLAHISRTAFEVIKLLYNVNEDVGDKFIKVMDPQIKPLSYFAKSIQWDLKQALFHLKSEQSELKDFTTNTVMYVETLVKEYIAAIEDLKKAYIEGHPNATFWNSLLNVSNISLSSDEAVNTFNAPITNLESTSQINLQNEIAKIRRSLRNIAGGPNYDPSSLIEKLKHSTYTTEKKFRTAIGRFVMFIDRSFREEDRKYLKDSVNYVKSCTHNTLDWIYVIALIFGIIASLLALVLLLTYVMATVATKGFHLDDVKEIVIKTSRTHYWGRLLLYVCYITASLMCFFWVISIFLFIVVVFPTGLCISTKDKSIFDITIDAPILRKHRHWFSIYSSTEFNITMKSSLENCAKDISYFPPLPNPIVNISEAESLKRDLDFSSVRKKFEEDVQQLTLANLSSVESTILNLTTVVNNVNFRPLFEKIQNFMTGVIDTNASIILYNIRNEESSTSEAATAIVEKANTAIKAYESLIADLSTSIANEETFSASIRMINISINSAMKEMNHLIWVANALENVIKNSSDEYISSLRKAVAEIIDGVFLDMEVAGLGFRRTVSFCPLLKLLYEKGVNAICKRALYPITTCWFGSFLVCLSLLLSVLLAVPSLSLFLFPPEGDSSENNETYVVPEELPSALNKDRSLAISEEFRRVAQADPHLPDDDSPDSNPVASNDNEESEANKDSNSNNSQYTSNATSAEDNKEDPTVNVDSDRNRL